MEAISFELRACVWSDRERSCERRDEISEDVGESGGCKASAGWAAVNSSEVGMTSGDG